MAISEPLEVGKASHLGRRPANQDWQGSYVPSEPQQWKMKGAIFAVADGMGSAGGWASQMAVQTLIQEYHRYPSPSVELSLTQAVQRANARIFAQVAQQPTCKGSGTTLTAAVIRGSEVYVANVGDSRAYLVRGRRAEQITRDHSFAAQEVARRVLTPLQARNHPWRHILTRFLGGKPTLTVDLFRRRLRRGDVILLCTDGLSECMTELELPRLNAARRPQDVAPMLVNLALRRGADDNVTAMVVRIEGEPEKRWTGVTRQPVYSGGRASNALQSVVGLVSGLAAAATLIVILIYLLAPPGK